MTRLFILISILFLFAIPAKAQTQIQSGPTDPATCNSNVGQFFYNTTSKTMKSCGPTDNTWTAVGGGSGSVTTTGTPISPELSCFSAPTSITNCNLSGDATTTNTSAVSVVKVNGGAIPISSPFVATDINGKFIATAAPSNPTLSQSAFYLSPACPAPNSGTCYNTSADTIQFTDATYTSGSAVVTTAGQTVFTSADIGKVIFGFSTCQTFNIGGKNAGLGAVKTTILSLNSSSSVNVSINATASSGAGTGCVIYGHPDDTATALVDTAMNAALTCPTVVFPSLNMIWETNHFLTQPSPCTRSAEQQGLSAQAGWGQQFAGQGKGITHIYIPPYRDLSATCSGGAVSTACLGNALVGQYWHDLTFSGGGQSRSGSTSNKVLFEPGCYAKLERMGFINYGASDANLNGIEVVNSVTGCLFGPQVFVDNTIDGWGSRSVHCGGQTQLYSQLTSYQDSNIQQGSGLLLDGNCFFYSLGGNEFLGNATSPANQDYILVNSTNNVYLGPNDACGSNGSTTANHCLTLNSSGALVKVNGGRYQLGNAANSVGILINSGSLFLDNAELGGGSTTNGVGLFGTGGSLYDLGGNRFTSGTFVPGTSFTGSLYGSASINGTTLATGNIALTSGWDTSTKGTFSGNSQRGQFTITAAGTPTLSPVVTITFPTGGAPGLQGTFWKAPNCTASIVGGTGLNLPTIITNGTISTTSYAFTLTGATPVATNTYVIQYNCSN